ncbi:MAG: TonB-dependent receptor [Porphyromonadaceae bacterium]|nr:TonB-dependent receptor [Porphyromonadaceae bacterium]
MNRIAIVIALIVASACTAQTARAEERSDTVMLNELVITALKQQQNLYELPLASTLVTAAETQRLNMVSIKSLSDLAPNVFLPDYGSRVTSSIYVRGLGARMDQPVVGLNVDNLTYLNKDAYDFDIPDIVRVEMLRGPQATLYGRNTMGGQINITTLSPFDWQGFRFAATAGNGPAARGHAAWYGKLNDDMGLSATVGYTYQNGWYRNNYNGSKTDRQNLLSGRVKYEWRPSRSFSLMNVAAVTSLNQSGYPYEYTGTGRIEYNDTCFYRRVTLSDALTLRWLTDRYSLTSVTSVQYIDDNLTLDQDFLPLSYFTLTQKKHETAFAEDLIARNPEDSKWRRTSGLFLFYKHNNMAAPVHFLDYGISQLIEQHRNDANPSYPIRWDTRDFPLNSDFFTPTFGVALYHESSVTVGKWLFTAGLRFDYEHVALKYHSHCDTGYMIYHEQEGGVFEPFRHISVNIDDHGRMSRQFFEVLPKIAVLYNLGDKGNNLYLNVSKGYKAGGFNTQMFSDILQQRVMEFMGVGGGYDPAEVVSYKPEKSWNFELGAHFSVLDGRLSGQADIFYIDCRDQQLTMFPDGTTTGRIMTNAGKTRSFGAELQLLYTPVEALTVTLNYGYTNARFRRFDNGLEDFRGKYLPYAPRNTLFGDVTYRIETPRVPWLDYILLDANVRLSGKIFWNESNTMHQNPYALPGASATFAKDDISLQLWGENLTDTKYNTFYFVSIKNEFLQRGLPLRFGATLRINF